MKFAAAVVMSFSLFLLASCTGSGGSNSIVPPVHAATYSNANVTGTYSIRLGTSLDVIAEMIGTFTADGAGNITSGTMTEYGTNAAINQTCSVSFSGTYNIESNANGSATINATFTPNGTSSQCLPSGTYKFNMQAAQQGSILLFGESDGIGLQSGTAAKQ